MNVGVQLRAVLFVIAAGSSAACGTDINATGPVAPSIPTPFVERIAQVGGQWAGQATLLPVEGTFTDLGECVQADLNERLATGAVSNEVVLSIAQTNSDVTARLTSTGTGLACTYKGKAAADAVILDAASCDAPLVVVRCSIDRVRDMKLVGSTVTARVEPSTDARTIRGTVTNTYNVFVSGEQAGVGGVVLKYDYTARRQ
jgi:hypothetical protein